MKSIALRSLPLIIVGALGACSGPAPDSQALVEQAVPPFQVEANQQHYLVELSTGAAAPSAWRPGLDTFLAQVAGGNPQAVHLIFRGNVSAATFSTLSGAAISDGVDPAKIGFEAAPATTPPQKSTAGERVDVIAEAYRVVPSTCPRATTYPPPDQSNDPSPNFGCSTVTDLELMVADPRDLVAGEDGAKAESEMTTAAVDRLRTDKLKKFIANGSFKANTGGSQ